MEEHKELTIGEIAIHLSYIKKELLNISSKLDALGEHYVTQQEFAPVKKLVYGVVSLILVAVVGAVVALVVK